MIRIDELPLLSREEIAQRLKAMKMRPGERPKEGLGVSLKCVEIFTCASHKSVFDAMRRPEYTSANLQLRITQFFARYDAGEISFEFSYKAGGWKTIYHRNPVPRVAPGGIRVEMTPAGPKLGFTRK